MSIQELTGNNFDQILELNKILVIDFCADWCKPCKAFEKVMLHVEHDYRDVMFGRVNVEREKALAEEFAVRSVPFVMIIKNRTVLYAESGVLSIQGLCEMLDQALLLSP
ncbi:MAG: thioredoxin family protein [Gammaproteobacteria bacterium]|nr:thioredoxin family protein [Gammaproteobacteria bacterium]